MFRWRNRQLCWMRWCRDSFRGWCRDSFRDWCRDSFRDSCRDSFQGWCRGWCCCHHYLQAGERHRHYRHWTAVGLRRRCCLVGLSAGWCCPVAGLWLFVLLRCWFVVVAAVVALRGGRDRFGDDRCLRVGRAVVAAAATAGGQRGKDCAGKEQFCGFHVVYLEVYWLGCVIAARIFRSCLLQMRA